MSALQGLDALVDAAADHLVGEEAEPAFDLVDPGGAGRGEVHVEAGMAGQPRLDRGGLVGAVVVADQVDVQVGGHGLVDRGQELLELGGAVPAVQLADHGAVGDVERGEQAGDAVADVVVGAPLGHAGHHRQHRLGPVQGLDLALLVDAQHHRPLGRVVVQPDHVDDLLHEQRIGGQLERVGPVRLEFEVPPDPPDRRLRQPGLRSAIDARDQCVALAGVCSSVATTTSSTWSSVIDGGRPGRSSSTSPSSRRARNRRAPLAHRRPATPATRRDLLVGRPVRARQHDPAPQRQRLRRLRPPRPTLQRLPLLIGQHQLGLRAPSPRHHPTPTLRSTNFRRRTLVL